MAGTDAINAAQFERDAEAHPDERTDLLFEAAAAWQRAGQPDRAIVILTELIRLGGDSGCYARVDLADVHFGQGDFDAMNAELKTLAHDPDLDVGHCELVADMLVEQGDLKAALRWYNRAVARMPDETIDELNEPDHRSNSMTKSMMRRRRDVRRGLGLDPDVLDEAVTDRAAAGSASRRLVFRRDELDEARRRWPSLPVPDDYYAGVERACQAAGSTVLLVPATAADLAAFGAATGEPADGEAVHARFAAAADPATTISWPPERNAACWCGAPRKYKKCCGSPA